MLIGPRARRSTGGIPGPKGPVSRSQLLRGISAAWPPRGAAEPVCTATGIEDGTLQRLWRSHASDWPGRVLGREHDRRRAFGQANVPFAVAVLILSGFFDFTDPSSHAALR